MHRETIVAWLWLSLSMDFQEDLIRLDLDCVPSSFESIPTRKLNSHSFAVPRDSLVYFKEEPGRKNRFLVICESIFKYWLRVLLLLGFHSGGKSIAIRYSWASLELPGNIKKFDTRIPEAPVVVTCRTTIEGTWNTFI